MLLISLLSTPRSNRQTLLRPSKSQPCSAVRHHRLYARPWIKARSSRLFYFRRCSLRASSRLGSVGRLACQTRRSVVMVSTFRQPWPPNSCNFSRIRAAARVALGRSLARPFASSCLSMYALWPQACHPHELSPLRTRCPRLHLQRRHLQG